MDFVQYPLSDFGVAQSRGTIGGFPSGSQNPYIPARNDDYLFRPEVMLDVLLYFKSQEVGLDHCGLYITGPTGSGKTSCVMQFAARANYPVIEITGHSRLEFPELTGQWVMVEGNMRFVHGPLSLAMTHGYVLVVNEADALDPAVWLGLNEVLQGSPLVIPENGGEVIRPHQHFRVVATGNTAGLGDSTGLYQGTLMQNFASGERWVYLHVDYPSEAFELQILQKCVPQLPEDVLKAMLDVARKIRDRFTGTGGQDRIEVTMSTRCLLRWARLSFFFKNLKNMGINPIEHALDLVLGNRAAPATREALQGYLSALIAL